VGGVGVWGCGGVCGGVCVGVCVCARMCTCVVIGVVSSDEQDACERPAFSTLWCERPAFSTLCEHNQCDPHCPFHFGTNKPITYVIPIIPSSLE